MSRYCWADNVIILVSTDIKLTFFFLWFDGGDLKQERRSFIVSHDTRVDVFHSKLSAKDEKVSAGVRNIRKIKYLPVPFERV